MPIYHNSVPYSEFRGWSVERLRVYWGQEKSIYLVFSHGQFLTLEHRIHTQFPPRAQPHSDRATKSFHETSRKSLSDGTSKYSWAMRQGAIPIQKIIVVTFRQKHIATTTYSSRLGAWQRISDGGPNWLKTAVRTVPSNDRDCHILVFSQARKRPMEANRYWSLPPSWHISIFV